VTEHVAVFTRDLATSGVSRAIVNLAKGLSERGSRVEVVLARAHGPHLSELDPRVRVIDLGTRRSARSLPALMRYLHTRRPTVMLACEEAPNGIALLAKRLVGGRTRVVISVHNALSVRARHATSLRLRLTPYLARACYRLADAVVAVSTGVADDLAEVTGLERDDIHVIYNPIHTAAIRALAQQPVEHPWFDSGGPPVLISVGRLVKQKDYPTLLRAFDRLRRRRSARLLILGDGTERSALKALVEELGLETDVALPGFVANPFAYMARAGLFALSSAWEGFGNVLVEAMAVGLPVVATDCPFGPAEILEGGKHGPLVPVGDVDALAAALDAMLDRQFSREALVRRAEAFGIEAITARYVAMMQDLDRSAAS
jgi:glycosyltransferase involved in cell wall biosynthesis